MFLKELYITNEKFCNINMNFNRLPIFIKIEWLHKCIKNGSNSV